MKQISFLFMLLLITSCSKNTPKFTGQQQEDDDPLSLNTIDILFIGNSLTYYNKGIPFHVQEFYDATSSEVISNTQEQAYGGFKLRDHLNNVATLRVIDETLWDYIILQENGNEAVTDPENALESIRDFQALLQGRPIRVLLYLTWAYKDQPEMTQQLVDFYTEANKITNWKVIPVGLGWRDFEAENDDIHLLGEDGVHPSLQGTYFASAMFFEALSGFDLPSNPYDANLDSDDAAYIRQYVSNALKLYTD